MADRGRTGRGRRGLAPWLVAVVALLLTITASGCSILTDGLAGYTWALTAITEQQPRIDHVVEPGNVGRYAITFANDGTATITADCNQVTATYTTTPGGGDRDRPGRVDDGHVPGRLARPSRSSGRCHSRAATTSTATR